MADTAAVAFQVTQNFSSPSTYGPAIASEPTAVAFNITIIGGVLGTNDDDVGSGPGGLWGASVVG